LSSFYTKMWGQKASLLNREGVLKSQLIQYEYMYNILFGEATVQYTLQSCAVAVY